MKQTSKNNISIFQNNFVNDGSYTHNFLIFFSTFFFTQYHFHYHFLHHQCLLPPHSSLFASHLFGFLPQLFSNSTAVTRDQHTCQSIRPRWLHARPTWIRQERLPSFVTG